MANFDLGCYDKIFGQFTGHRQGKILGLKSSVSWTLSLGQSMKTCSRTPNQAPKIASKSMRQGQNWHTLWS